MKILLLILHTLFKVFSSSLLFWLLLPLFVIVNALDAQSTYLVLKPNHYHRERNPLARWVFRKLGIPQGIIIFKGVLLSVLIPAMSFYAGNDLFSINIVLVVSNVVFIFVVKHNYVVYKRIKEV